jgi:hypothetical protein
MAKSALLYSATVPVSHETHLDWCVDGSGGYAFARGVNFLPITTPEFEQAAASYPIVFIEEKDAIRPVSILGFEQDQNLFVGSDGRWDAAYIPAFARRYPFIFATMAGRDSLGLCIDEAYSGVNQAGRGERLFLSGGGRSPYLNRTLEFLQQYQSETVRSAELAGQLRELDLLEPAQAQVSLSTGQQMSLGGFLTVNRDRLRALDGAKLKELARVDWLELIYIHLFSLANFAALMDRMATRSDAAEQSSAD